MCSATFNLSATSSAGGKEMAGSSAHSQAMRHSLYGGSTYSPTTLAASNSILKTWYKTARQPADYGDLGAVVCYGQDVACEAPDRVLHSR